MEEKTKPTIHNSLTIVGAWNSDIYFELTLNFYCVQDKVKAAKGLIRRLHSERPSLVHSMEQLCEAYIDLAYHDVSAHRRERKPIKFPASCTLVKLAGKLREVAVPTVDIEVYTM